MSDDQPVRRVLMTTDTVGGVWTFSLELARALGSLGIEVVLAAMGGERHANQYGEAACVDNIKLFTSDFKLEWMDKPGQDLEAANAGLLDLEARVAPDVVHLNFFGPGTARWSTPVVLTAHSCVKSWWRAVKGEPAPQSW